MAWSRPASGIRRPKIKENRLNQGQVTHKNHRGVLAMEYPSFTSSGLGSETIIMSNGEYVLLNMVDKSSRQLGKSPEEAREKLREIKKDHLAYQIP